MRGTGRDGAGNNTTSSTSWNVPWWVTRPPAISGVMIARASSKRAARRSKGMPNASNSVLVPAGPETQDESAPADLVDGGGHLGQHRGGMESGAGHQGPEFHALGLGGQCRQHGPGLPRTALGSTVAAVQQVIAQPHAVETVLFGDPDHLAVLGPTHDTFDLGQLDTDTDSVDEAHEFRLRACPTGVSRSTVGKGQDRGRDVGQEQDIRSDPRTIDTAWMDSCAG